MTATQPDGSLIVTDLDRTMIYSRNAIGDAVPEADLTCVEHYHGKPLSYMTIGTAAALRSLTAKASVVPATTRTIEQFGRIQLPGAPWRYAITSNGGNILIDGRPDRQWRSAVDAAVRAGGPELPEVVTELRRRIGSDWVEACRTADDLFCYLVVKPVAVPTDFLDQWSRWCAKRGWGVSQQGRKIYTMPIAVCKSHAVTEIRCRMLDDRTLGADALVLTAGDGALDAQMLALADAGIRPRHGELESLGWIHPTVTVTMASGIRASVEILRWFDTRAVTPRVPPRSAAPSAE